MKKQIWYLIAGAIVLLFGLAACQNSTDPLKGTSWKLESINGAAVIPGRDVTAEFEDGRVGGSSGCNSYGGKYEVNGTKLTVSEVVSTLMACADPTGMMEQESAFLGALGNSQSFAFTQSQLIITTSDGVTLTFTPKP